MATITIRVEAKPDASREKVQESTEHVFAISVREPARGGAANARIKTLLALRFGVPETRVRMRTGAQSRHKRFDVILDK